MKSMRVAGGEWACGTKKSIAHIFLSWRLGSVLFVPVKNPAGILEKSRKTFPQIARVYAHISKKKGAPSLI